MKLNKKKVFVSALVVCLIAILSMGTLAWFNDSDSVTNNFYVGGQGGDADVIFHLDVYESVDYDKDGKIDHTLGWDGDESADGAGVGNYQNVVPGDKLWKRVYAHNKGLYDQWVRFSVTIDNASEWQTLEQKYGFKLHDLMLEGDGTKLVESDEWTFAANETVMDDAADTVTYVFYYNTVLSASAAKPYIHLFNYVQIPEAFTQHDVALFEGGLFTMNIVGEAVQVENVVANNAIEAFAFVNG